jgi:putative membrane protein insertion efficiency factor
MASTKPTALRRIPMRMLIQVLRAYRLLLSPWLGNQCRFEPTCSLYAIDALERHGALAGSYLGARRVLRCHPWCAGGLDPVPAQAPALWPRASARGAMPMSPGPATLRTPADTPSPKIAP